MRNDSFRKIALVGLAAWIGIGPQVLRGADCEHCAGSNVPSCPVNSRYFGYYPTQWRRWPGTEPSVAQPNQPSAKQGALPLVEPPKPTDETPSVKVPGAEQPPETSVPDASTGELPAPTAPKGTVRGGAGRTGTQPAPAVRPSGPAGPSSEPRSLRYVPRANQAESLANRSPTPAPRTSKAWPPSNELRDAEFRANFQMADGVAFPTFVPKPLAAANQPLMTQSPANPPQTNQPQADQPQPQDATVAPVKPEADPLALPVSSTTSPAAFSSFSDLERENKIAAVAPPVSRVPLLPFKAWSCAPPALSTRNVEQSTTAEATPQEASKFALTPPTKVTDVEIPSIAAPAVALSRRPSPPAMQRREFGSAVAQSPKTFTPDPLLAKTLQSVPEPAAQSPKLKQIDPLAIGRSLTGSVETETAPRNSLVAAPPRSIAETSFAGPKAPEPKLVQAVPGLSPGAQSPRGTPQTTAIGMAKENAFSGGMKTTGPNEFVNALPLGHDVFAGTLVAPFEIERTRKDNAPSAPPATPLAAINPLQIDRSSGPMISQPALSAAAEPSRPSAAMSPAKAAEPEMFAVAHPDRTATQAQSAAPVSTAPSVAAWATDGASAALHSCRPVPSRLAAAPASLPPCLRRQ